MVLLNAGYLELLPLIFGTITITPEVAREFGEELPTWVTVEPATDRFRQQTLQNQLDVGEASCIALALEKSNSAVIIDERKGRKVASDLGLKVIGTMRVGIIAKEKGRLPAVAPFLADLRTAGFRASDSLHEEALRLAGE